MSVEKGGRASKLGNSYERIYAIETALDVITGRASSLLWEPIGNDEIGVDIWVTYPSKIRVGVQLKRQNKEKDVWTPCDLLNNKVLHNAKVQLERASHHEFRFISQCRVQSLADLRGRLNRTNDTQEFIEHHINPNRQRKKAFETLLFAWKLNLNNLEDIDYALSLFKRISFIEYGELILIQQAEVKASSTLNGNNKQNISTIGNILDENIGINLTSGDLRQLFRDKQLSFRHLEGDPNLPEAIEDNQDRFNRTIKNSLIRGTSFSRKETSRILEEIHTDKPPQLIIVHGNAGCGKSVILHQVYEQLITENTPVLPIDLRTRQPEGTPEQYGQNKCKLPSSPAIALNHYRAEKHAVLILDQMDSLRYNSIHSDETWSFFTDILKEAVINDKITTIATTRSFDFENDPRISEITKLINSYRATVIEIKINDFDKKDVIDILTSLELKPETFPEHQLELLRKPNLLHIWLDALDKQHNHFTFSSPTQLIDKFFEMIASAISIQLRLDIDQVWKCVNDLSEILDRNGSPGISNHLFANKRHIIQELASNNIVYIEDNTIYFSHQSYLDYLVAKRVFKESIFEGNTPQTWLLNNQGLFRREQLRQLLNLLRDSEPEIYACFLNDVLTNPKTRFHIKHLIYGFLKQIDSVQDCERTIIKNILLNPAERSHVIANTLNNSYVWFDALNTEGVFQYLIENNNRTEVSLIEIMRYLKTVSHERPTEIDKLLKPLWRNNEEWETELIPLLSFDPSEDTTEMQAFRLRLLREGKINISWSHVESLAKTQPEYSFQIAEAILCCWLDSQSNKPESDFSLTHSEVEESSDYCTAIQDNSIYCWDLFKEIYLRIMRYNINKTIDIDNPNTIIRDNHHLSKPGVSFVDQIMSATLHGLAASQPALLIEKIQELSKEELPFFEYKIMKCLETGHMDLADFAIQWICENCIRWTAGDTFLEHKWDPVCNIIRRFSAHCSNSTYRKLERNCMGYHDDWEKTSVKLQLTRIREGILTSSNDYGRAQNHLLDSLPNERMSDECIRKSALWKSKFGNPRNNTHPRHERLLRSIHSPIPNNRAHLVSDKNWIDICSRDWSTKDGLWKDTGHKTYSECSVRHFSETLQIAAQKNPVRFANLATQLPPDVDPQYYTSIIRGITDSLNQSSSNCNDHVTLDQIEEIADHIADQDDSYFVRCYCRIVEGSDVLDHIISMHHRLIRFSSNPDPQPGEFAVHSYLDNNTDTAPDISASAINCARGVVSSAIAMLISRRSKLIPFFMPTIRSLLSDKHPAVQHEAFRLCLALFNHSDSLAIELAIEASIIAEDTVLESRWFQDLINYARHKHMEALKPIITRMLNSTHSKLAQWGALWSCVRYLETDDEKDLYDQCKPDNANHRLGKAEAARDLYEQNKITEACASILSDSFNDDDRDVRKMGSRIFYLDDFFDRDYSTELAMSFSYSKAFHMDPERFLRVLDSSTQLIEQYEELILRILDQYLTIDVTNSDRAYYHLYISDTHITSLLFKLYKHAYSTRNKGLQEKCLDRWDALLQQDARKPKEIIDCL